MQIVQAETKDLGNELDLTGMGVSMGCMDKTYSPAHRRTWPPWAAPYQWPVSAPAGSHRCKPNCSCSGQRRPCWWQLLQVAALPPVLDLAFCNIFFVVAAVTVISAIVFHLIHVAARVFD